MAQLISSWSNVTLESLNNVWFQVLSVLPLIIGALIIFIIGLIIAVILDLAVTKIFRAIKLDNLLIKSGVGEYFARGGLRVDSGKFFGKIVYWFVIIAFGLAASDILGFYAFSDFLKTALNYIPNIVIAVLILLVTILVANFLKTLIKSSVASAKIEGAGFLSSLAWWITVIFGLLAALDKLHVTGSIINIIISGLIAMIAIAGGIAFGLGGKDYAVNLLSKIKDQLESRK
jgi:hypothetical protein